MINDANLIREVLRPPGGGGGGGIDADGTGINAGNFRENLEISNPVVLNEHRLDYYFKHAQDFDTPGLPVSGTLIGIGTFGDSMMESAGGIVYTIRDLIKRRGLGGLSSIKLTGSLLVDTNDVLVATLSGGATNVASLASYTPQNSAYNIPNGGKVSLAKPAAANLHGPWTKVIFWYLTRAGGGNLTFNVIQNGVTVFTDTVATAGAIGMGVVEVLQSDGLLPGSDFTLEAVGDTADCYFLGATILADYGVVPIVFGQGGAALVDQNAVPTAVLDLFQSTLPMRLMFHTWKEYTSVDPTFSEVIEHMDLMEVHFADCSHVYYGQSPTATGSAEDLSLSRQIRQQCLERNLCFVDAFQAAVNYANLTDLTWQGDGTHLTVGFWKFVSSVFLAKVNRLEVAGAWVDESIAKRDFITNQSQIVQSFWTGALNNAHNTGTGSNAASQVSFRSFATGNLGTAAGTLQALRASVNRTMTPSLPFDYVFHLYGSGFIGGSRGWLQIGVSDANYITPDKTRLSFGIEFALPSNVGLTDASNHAARLFAWDGVVLFESAWGVFPSGSASLDIACVLTWDVNSETLTLRANGAGVSSPPLKLVQSLRMPAFSGKTLQGANIIAGVSTTVAAETATLSFNSPPFAVFRGKNRPLTMF